MMPKEIEKLIAIEENLDLAKDLAWELGYCENYPYGITNPYFFDEMDALITELVGINDEGRWPEAVEESYSQGARDGWWDS